MSIAIGSDCSEECSDCYVSYVGGCLAGHGDDLFIKATAKDLFDYIIRVRDKGYIDKITLDRMFKKFPDLICCCRSYVINDIPELKAIVMEYCDSVGKGYHEAWMEFEKVLGIKIEYLILKPKGTK